MSRIFISGVVCVVAAGTLLGQELKIGVVNSEVVVQSYPQFRQAEEQLAREAQGWQAERAGWEAGIERLQSSVIEAENQLRTGQTSFSEKRKAELQSEIDSLKADYGERINRRMLFEQERLAQRRAELLSQVFEVVNQTIQEIGEANDYHLIIDSSNGTVVYARNPEDVTDQLLRRLQDK